MQNRYLYSLRLILFLTDIILINLAFLAAFRFANLLDKELLFDTYRHYWIYLNASWLICAHLFRLYHLQTLQNSEKIYRSTWKSTMLHIFLFILYLLFSKDQQISRTFFCLFYFLVISAFFLSRFASTVFEIKLLLKYKLRRPVALMGKNATSLKLASYFQQNRKQYDFGGFINEDTTQYVDPTGKVLMGTCEQIRKAAENGIKEIYVSLTSDRIHDIGYLVREAEQHCIHMKFLPDLSQMILPSFKINHLAGLPVINLRVEPLEEIQNRFRKRLFDIAFSLLVIAFILTWLYPIMAIIIKIQSPGPLLFKQLRNGKDNKPFWCYKFRSMRINNESDKRQASRNDERVTPFGHFIRRTSIDELPQFFNVLLGTMSIVGPRPHMLKHTEQYREIIDKYMVRQNLRPGITGWAQVNGLRGETNTLDLMEKRVEHDIWYLENWSLMLDIKIVFMTLIHVFRGDKQAY
jgi:putative colanic acid biosysnthesis UDP-glucose lipid carrier transferase